MVNGTEVILPRRADLSGTENNGPLVSIIVPTRNSSRTLEACLSSIRRQTHRPIQLIVVDNGSVDGTVEIAKGFADIVANCDRERSAQRNLGAKLAAADYLLFIDSDMEVMPTLVVECLDLTLATGTPAVVIPEVSIGEGFWARCRALERSCYVGDDRIESARFFTRSAFEVANGFDEEMIAFEDRDLSLRVMGKGGPARISGYITHNEGNLRLGEILAKKQYYASAFRSYWRKHGFAAFHQANLLARPAFAKNWRVLIRHPALTLGVFVLKLMELSAALSGGLGLARPQPNRYTYRTDPARPRRGN